MDIDWLGHPAASGVLALTTDPRPAWLWSGDGERLLWRNGAARLMGARLVDGALDVPAPATPIKGQIGRIMRLGLLGQTSRTRMQFTAGGRPLAAACQATPLALGDAGTAVLVVASEPLLTEVRTHAKARELAQPELGGVPFRLEDADGALIASSEAAIGDGSHAPARFAAGPDGALLIVFPQADTGAASRDLAGPEAETETAPLPETGPEEHFVPPAPDDRGLSGLFDRLAGDEALFTPLGADDDRFDPALVHEHAHAAARENETSASWVAAQVETAPDVGRGWSIFAEPGDFEADAFGSETSEPVPDPVGTPTTAPEGADDSEPADAGDTEMAPAPPAVTDGDQPEVPEGEELGAIEDADEAEMSDEEAPATLWKIVGRGLTPTAVPESLDAAEGAAAQTESGEGEDEMPAAPMPADALERVSRYNFEELSRILTDRVGRDPQREEEAGSVATSAPVVALSEESLVLNRLPLGLLIFRDQDILFVNRALVDLTGHESSESLRALGLSAIIPSVEGQPPAGPVTQILRRDGAKVSVSARLQSVSWQGRPAFMLSARVPEFRPQDEHAVKAFAGLVARRTGADMLEADRTGIISTYLSQGVIAEPPQAGDPLTQIVVPADRQALKAFLESPARRAETERPALRLGTVDGGSLLLFVEGRAGPASGFFGLVPARADAGTPEDREDGLSGNALVRISRDLRRPLNTILGFSEIMAGEAFGPLGNPRYLEYARDIETAGRAISDLADELDDFVRLVSSPRSDTRGDAVDLAALLESCLAKVRAEAVAARVLLRSSISERLPRVVVDTASLSQAVLNLLASAITHTGHGGRVVLSAQREESGAVSIHVRDTSTREGDIADRFVVFREGRGGAGEARRPAASAIGLTLTRSLIAVNALEFSIDPASDHGTLMTLVIPAERVVAGAGEPDAP